MEEKYEEWLTTIASSRLMYNTIEELEDMLDNHSIHNNGVRKSFSSEQKMRAAFRDLRAEAELMTDGIVKLEDFMQKYEKTWDFYYNNLYRRSNPEHTALEILTYCSSPYKTDGISDKKQEIYSKARRQGADTALLVLMVMKIMPGYKSKGGNVTDMAEQYQKAIGLMEKFTTQGDGTMFNVLPSITLAKEEANKTRLTLYSHITRILEFYEAYASTLDIYDTADYAKSILVQLNIDGYWNECGGKQDSTEFWQIEEASNLSYFATKWTKDAEKQITGIRYTLFIYGGENGELTFYFMHPESIMKQINGGKYEDKDHTWYDAEIKKDNGLVTGIHLQRTMQSSAMRWNEKIELTRCTDKKVTALYDKWLKECKVVKQYEKLEYEFHPNIYAVTQDHIYIPSEKEGEFYKIPKEGNEGLYKVRIGDNAGMMRIGEKHYIVFDEIRLFISTDDKTLRKHGIKRVNHID